MGGKIPTAGAAVVALAAGGIIAIAFGSWLVTGWARVHGGQVYPASNNFTNSKLRLKGYQVTLLQYSVYVYQDGKVAIVGYGGTAALNPLTT